MAELEIAGTEYAIVRLRDRAYLFDADGTGRDASWEDDEDNGTWWGTKALALAAANANGLTVSAADDTLADGYTVESRDYPYEDDLVDE